MPFDCIRKSLTENSTAAARAALRCRPRSECLIDILADIPIHRQSVSVASPVVGPNMAGKKKKEKKPQKEAADLISAVDKTFYEQTIADLNKKLAHLKGHNVRVEEKNAELEGKLARLEEDQADITSFLSRTLKTQANSIAEFEEKLAALATVRDEENERFRGVIKDWETKYKAMHEQLTSELKLLNGKLNSLEEFRIQKDELMAKFDQQETELREQSQRHKETIYELEKQQILDKDKLKSEVESRLQQLSDEFARSNEIRIAAHVQRMVRENIALSNQVDRLSCTAERLQKENKALGERTEADRLYAESLLAENAFLIEISRKRLCAIQKLTSDCERLKRASESREQSEKQRQMAEVREMAARKEQNEAKQRCAELKRVANEQVVACSDHFREIGDCQRELGRQRQVLKKISSCVGRVLEPDAADAEATRAQRNLLLAEIHSILSAALQARDSEAEESNGDESVRPLDASASDYRRGLVGITPLRRASHHAIKYSHSTYKMRRKSALASSQSEEESAAQQTEAVLGCSIIDADARRESRLTPADESVRAEDEECG